MTQIEEQLIPRRILEDILSHKCSIIADNQMGKTNLSKLIISEMVKQNLPVQNKIFDVAQTWRHNFLSTFKFQEINEATRKVWTGDENILYDIAYEDSEQIMQFMGNEVMEDYRKAREAKKAANGKLGNWILYTLEESQNSLGSYALNKISGRLWLKAISESANFNLSFLFIGQRASDISAKAVERAQSRFIGRTTGDNNTRKLRGLIGSKSGMTELGQPLHEVAKTLKVGQFIYWSGSEAYMFECPRFEDLYPNQKPEQVEPPKKRWMKIFG